MSVIPPHSRPLQQFYRSGPMPCPYLPGRMERKLFTRLVGQQASGVNSALSRAGFRRSHDIVYRPVCSGCAACVPVRIPVATFSPNKTMRKVMRANADLVAGVQPASATAEQFQVFASYQAARHSDSDMSRMGMTDYAAMIEEGQVDSRLYTLRDGGGTLMGAILTDRLDDGFSAVYSFYNPDMPERSLGTHLILTLVDQARREGLPHVYLGYWIEGSRKMDYKRRFQPLEALGRDGWLPLDPAS
ncbi:arginyltransferase [Nitrospirillum amazonense]|uniref:Aspartate/glutamate leucyltransferase n=1 Tax=Nitrospirillum amazonense TaxID=28077 RepID=A0A560K9W2_9PROT|nr:arginyltransferase [Nitrospirillum amazonense]MDG3441511.1 arginyltransferase [Nitrospirillum amazonense]TWB79996.1 arginine-tRNA-protein transferase [Nitrospirillum amazonense]